MIRHEGSCHCGAVRLMLSVTPDEAGECNCSLCRRLGWLLYYSTPNDLGVEGNLAGYRQKDGTLTCWFCPTCGCTTHWTATDPTYGRLGVNLRMFDPLLWRDLPRRAIDGASF